MSTSITHECDDCSCDVDDRRDYCLCSDCLSKREDSAYEKGKREGIEEGTEVGYKQGFEEGQSVNPNK